MTAGHGNAPLDSVVLAFDGGNSKTDVVLVAGDGEVLARARSGPFIPHLVGAVAAVDSLDSVVETILRDSGAPRIDHVAVYVANADLPIEEERLRDAVVAKRWSDSVVLDNDTVALLRTGTNAGFGVAVVCGAGINCIGIGLDGTRVRFPALGRITGDWGGGIALADETLWWAARSEDGRGPFTALAHTVARYFGFPTAVKFAEAIHLGAIDPARMHELLPLLFTTAEAGDAVALGIVAQQAEEIVLLAEVSLGRLGLLETDTDIVLGGGILASNSALLLDPIRLALASRAPRGRIVQPEDVPVFGSALLGLEQLWRDRPETAPDDRNAAAERLRSALSARVPA